MAKRPNRYDKALSRLPDTLSWSNSLDISELKEFVLAGDGLPRIFLGSGGSLSAAHLAAELSVERGIVAAAMTPYRYIFSAWSRLPAKVLIISAGGSNLDALNAYKTARSNPAQAVGAILMKTSTPLEGLMAADGVESRFVFSLPNKDGFLATNSLLAFYSLLLGIYRDEKIGITDCDFSDTVGETLRKFIKDTYSLSTEEWDEHNAALYEARETDRFYVLYSPDTLPIAIDLESRFSEGSVGCLQISDYRNFAHGRFNWFAQRKGQTAIIALITPVSRKVAEDILKELPEYIPVMRLETDREGSSAILGMLVKGMYLSKHLGQRWGLDIGSPKVADFGRAIHRKDFL